MFNDPARTRLLLPPSIKFRQYAGPPPCEQCIARILSKPDQNGSLPQCRQPFRKTWMGIDPAGWSTQRLRELRLLLARRPRPRGSCESFIVVGRRLSCFDLPSDNLAREKIIPQPRGDGQSGERFRHPLAADRQGRIGIRLVFALAGVDEAPDAEERH